MPSSTFTQFPLVWDAFVTTVARAWQAFHQFWIMRTQKQPILIVKYEHLSCGGAPYVRTVGELQRFLYNTSVAPPPWTAAELHASRRRAECLQEVQHMGGLHYGLGSFYTPRVRAVGEDGGGHGGGIYRPEQRARVLSTLRRELCLLGYSEDGEVKCSDAELHAIAHGNVAEFLPALAFSARPPTAPSRSLMPSARSRTPSRARDHHSPEITVGIPALRNSERRRRLRYAGASTVASAGLKLNQAGCQDHRDHPSNHGPSHMQCSFTPEQVTPLAPGVEAQASGTATHKMPTHHPNKVGTDWTTSRMLHHPFQALACVRQAAAARGINISSWDRS